MKKKMRNVVFLSLKENFQVLHSSLFYVPGILIWHLNCRWNTWKLFPTSFGSLYCSCWWKMLIGEQNIFPQIGLKIGVVQPTVLGCISQHLVLFKYKMIYTGYSRIKFYLCYIACLRNSGRYLLSQDMPEIWASVKPHGTYTKSTVT